MRYFEVTEAFNLCTHNTPRDLTVGDTCTEFELDAYVSDLLGKQVTEITEDAFFEKNPSLKPAPAPDAVVSP